MRPRHGHSRSGSRRFAAILLFQFRVVIRGDSGKRRVCEKRIINVVARGARQALSKARKAGRIAEYRYRNLDGHQVFCEFVGLLDLMELGVECGPDEVWYDIITMVRPMERRQKLIPRAPELNAIRSLRRRRPNTRNEKTLYIKADARVPYARLVEVIDAVRNSGVDRLTLLTAQQDTADQGRKLVASKGLEMRVLNPRP